MSQDSEQAEQQYSVGFGATPTCIVVVIGQRMVTTMSREAKLDICREMANEGALSTRQMDLLLRIGDLGVEAYKILLENLRRKPVDGYRSEDAMILLYVKKFARETGRRTWLKTIRDLERKYYKDLSVIRTFLVMDFESNDNVTSLSIEDADRQLREYVNDVHPRVCRYVETYVRKRDWGKAKKMRLKFFLYKLKEEMRL